MKKILLITSLALFTVCAQAQIIFNVESPASVSGLYNYIYATDSLGGDGWNGGDMNDPANSILDTLAFAYDDGNTIPTGMTTTSGDSASCGSVISDVAGKIAVIYRGECQFGTKALNAQNAGAVAVVLINNDGPASGLIMQGGDDGMSVTIPVFMIGENDGALIAAQMEIEDVVVFIGNKQGYYGNDITIYPSSALRAQQFSNVQRVCQDSTEFTVDIGSWIFNFGSNNQTGVSLSASIIFNGSAIYSEVSDTFSIISGDSSYVTLPRFAQGSYDLGYYHMDYVISSDSIEDDPKDNTINADFMMSETEISYAPTDSVTETPISSNHYRTVSRGLFDEQTFCIHYQNANASRLGVTGMSFSAIRSSDIGSPITGEYLDVYVYEWTDNFTGLSDPLLTAVNTTELGTGQYVFTSDLQDSSIYVKFFDPLALQDNIRYLFCFTTYSDTVYYGMNANIDYTQNVNIYDQPISPIVGETSTGGSSWFISGFGPDLVPAISVTTIDAAAVGVEEAVSEEKEIIPFPNPARTEIHIPFNDASVTSISIYDISGKLIDTQSVSIGNKSLVTVNVTDIPNGTYIFTASYENGSTSNFNVVVRK